jgi:hypothetical protein
MNKPGQIQGLTFPMALPSAWSRMRKEGEIGVRSFAPHPNFTTSFWGDLKLPWRNIFGQFILCSSCFFILVKNNKE